MEDLKKEEGENGKTHDRAEELEKENKRLEEALKKKEELLLKEENLALKSRLGGKSEAGTPMKTQEETDKEIIQAEADRIYGHVYDLKKRKI